MLPSGWTDSPVFSVRWISSPVSRPACTYFQRSSTAGFGSTSEPRFSPFGLFTGKTPVPISFLQQVAAFSSRLPPVWSRMLLWGCPVASWSARASRPHRSLTDNSVTQETRGWSWGFLFVPESLKFPSASGLEFPVWRRSFQSGLSESACIPISAGFAISPIGRHFFALYLPPDWAESCFSISLTILWSPPAVPSSLWRLKFERKLAGFGQFPWSFWYWSKSNCLESRS